MCRYNRQVYSKGNIHDTHIVIDTVNNDTAAQYSVIDYKPLTGNTSMDAIRF